MWSGVEAETTLRVLLIDGDEAGFHRTRDLLAGMEGRRCHVEWQRSYHAGLAAIDGRQYDVCLVDQDLGARDGLQLVREAVTRGTRVPLILLTPAFESGTDLRALEAGAADYLVKGRLDTPQLERSLRHAVRLAESRHPGSRREPELVVLCVYCGRVRSGTEGWRMPAEPRSERLGRQLSHGCCPACFRRVVQPELDNWDAHALERHAQAPRNRAGRTARSEGTGPETAN